MIENNINANCAICGAGYHICNSCLEQKSLKPWRTITDTIEHYKIYMAIHGYTLSKNKEVGKQELQSCDLSGMENFKPEIKTAIQEIMAEPKTEKTVSNKRKKLVETGEKNKTNDIDE